MRTNARTKVRTNITSSSSDCMTTMDDSPWKYIRRYTTPPWYESICPTFSAQHLSNIQTVYCVAVRSLIIIYSSLLYETKQFPIFLCCCRGMEKTKGTNERNYRRELEDVENTFHKIFDYSLKKTRPSRFNEISDTDESTTDVISFF